MFSSKNAPILIIIGLLVSALLVISIIFGTANNNANGYEQQIKFEYRNNQVVLSQYSQKVLEAAQVPGMMRDDLVKVATAAIKGRYGENGSQAAIQLLKEQNPNLDASLYSKLQQIIESGRNEFKTSQSRLLDVKRSYETALGSWPEGVVMKALGYPKLPLANYDVTTTEATDKAFKSGIEAPIQLRN